MTGTSLISDATKISKILVTGQYKEGVKKVLDLLFLIFFFANQGDNTMSNLLSFL